MNALPFVISALVAILVPTSARPCSPASGVFMTPAAGEVPANLPAIDFRYVGPSLTMPLEERVHVTEHMANGTEAELPVTVVGSSQNAVITFSRALVEGATYRVAIAGACSSCEGGVFWYEQELVAGPESPFPTTLGSVVVGAESDKIADVWTSSGSCTSPADITARDVTLALSPEAEPWKRALIVSWSHTTSRRSQFSDFLEAVDRWQYGVERMAYHVCKADDDSVDPGDPELDFTITVDARIPGAAPAIASASADTSLSCADSADGGEGCAAGGSLASALTALLVAAYRKVTA